MHVHSVYLQAALHRGALRREWARIPSTTTVNLPYRDSRDNVFPVFPTLPHSDGAIKWERRREYGSSKGKKIVLYLQ